MNARFGLYLLPAPLVILTLFIMLASTLYASAVQGETEQTSATLDILNAQQAEQLRAETQAEIQRIPAATVKGKPDGRLKSALERRLGLLDEADSLRASREKLAQIRSGLPVRLHAAEAALANLSSVVVTNVPAELDQTAYDALEKTLSEAQLDLQAKQIAQTEQQHRFEVILPKLIEDTTRRMGDAIERQNHLTTLTADPGNTLERRTLEVQIENAGFNFALARNHLNQLNSEMSLAPELEPVLSLERDLAEKRVAQLDQQFTLYTAAFGATLTRESEQADADLARAQRASESAGTPAERFITDWEARIARSKKGKSDVEALLVNVRRDASDQEKRLTAETGEASAIKEFIDRSGSSDFVGERLKRTLQQLRQRQALLERALEAGPVRNLSEYRARRFAIEDSLIGLGEQFALQRDAIAADLSQIDRSDSSRVRILC